MSLEPVDIDIRMRQNVSAESESATRDFGKLTGTVTQGSQSMDRALSRLGYSIGAAFSVTKLYDWSKAVKDVTRDNQLMASSFEVLLGSKSKSGQMVAEIRSLALKSPINEKSFSAAAQTLLGFNVEAGRVIPTLQQLGAISMGNTDRFNSLALAFAQMHSTGKLMGQDLLQMVNAGFNPLMIMSEKTGKSISVLRDEMSKGAISSEMVADAFRSATEEGGRFFGMMDKQSQEIAGYEARLDSAIRKMMINLGEGNNQLIKDFYSSATAVVENYEEIGKILIDVIAVYGAYKAAVLAVAVVHRSMAIASQARIWLQLAASVRTAGDAMAAFNLLTKLSPIGVLTAAVAAVAAGYKLFGNNASEVISKQTLLNRVSKDATTTIAREKSELQVLLSVAKNEKVSREDRRRAIENLNRISPEYLGNLQLENISSREAAASIDAYTASLEKNARAKAVTSQIEAISEKEITNAERLRELAEEEAARNPVQKFMDWANRAVTIPGTVNNSYSSQVDREREAIEKENAALARKKDILLEIHAENSSQSRPADISQFIQIEADLKNLEHLKEKHAALVAKIGNSAVPFPFDEMMLKEYVRQMDEVEERLEGYKGKEKLEPVRNFDYWDKQKESAEKALKAMDDAQRGGAEWLKQEKLLKEAQEKLKQYDFSGKSDKSTEKEADRREEAARTLAEKLKKIALETESMQVAALEEGKDKRLKEIDLEHRQTLSRIEKNRDEIIEAYNKSKGLVGSRKVTADNYASVLPELATDVSRQEDAALALRNRNIVEAERQAAVEVDEIRTNVSNRFKTRLDNEIEEIRRYYGEQVRLKKISVEEAARLSEKEVHLARASSALDRNEFNSGMSVYRLETGTMDSSMTEAAEREKTEILRRYALERIEILRSMGTEEAAMETEQLEATVKRYDKVLAKPRSLKGALDEKVLQRVKAGFEKLGYTAEEASKKAYEYFDKYQQGGGKAVEILSFMQDSFGGISEELDMALDAAMAIAEGFATGGLVGGIEAAASQLISTTLKLLTAKKEVSQSTIDSYNAYMDVLDRLISKQIDSLESLDHSGFLNSSKKAYENLRKEQAASLKILKETLRSGAGLFSHSVGYKANKMLKGFTSELRSLGIYQSDIGRMTDKQLVSLMNIPEAWAKLPDEVRSYIEAVSDAMEQAEDLNRQIQDMLLDFDYHEVTDAIIDALTDSSIDNALEAVEEKVDGWISTVVKNILRQVGLIAPVTTAVNNLMKGIGEYDKDGNLVGFKNRAELSRDVFSQFKRSIMSIAGEFSETWSWIEELFESSGIHLSEKNKEEENTRTGATGGLQPAVSQDSVNALMGELKYYRITSNNIEDLSRESRDIQKAHTLALDRITEHTENLKYLKTMNDTMNDFKNRGVKMI